MKPLVHFPLGTATRVQVTKGGDCFVAPARVVFSSVKGMGLKFAEIAKEQHEVLEKVAWTITRTGLVSPKPSKNTTSHVEIFCSGFRSELLCEISETFKSVAVIQILGKERLMISRF